ncbi:MAG: hypothetical protein OK454_10110, partial [Thaumarchaeota archaeon]|nr:hypothetical protein [Nitrososphaerota archaeon]
RLFPFLRPLWSLHQLRHGRLVPFWSPLTDLVSQAVPLRMSGHEEHYDDGYGHQQHGNTDSYYPDENTQYYDHNGYEHVHGGGDGY